MTETITPERETINRVQDLLYEDLMTHRYGDRQELKWLAERIVAAITQPSREATDA